MRLEARQSVSKAGLFIAPIIAVIATMIVCALLVAAIGGPVMDTFWQLILGGFGSRFAFTETLTRATPFILTGLAVATAFRARLYNIGAEGQLYMGALAAVGVGGLHGGSGWDLSPTILFPAMLVAAACAGGLMLLVPAWLKGRFAVDEVVTTLLLNFIALLFVSMMLDGVMKDPSAMGWPQSVALNPELELTRLLDPTRLHSGLLIAIFLALIMWAVNRYTKVGFMMRNTGHNPTAAKFLGLPINRIALGTAMLSGAFAGLAGAIEVAGRAGYVTLDMSPGYGYSGVVVAMLAALNPIGVVISSIFIAGVLVGADSMSRAINVPSYIADVIVATALITMLVATVFTRYRLKRH